MSGTGRVLGIDYGEARIGLALSDPLRMVATPLETVDAVNRKQAFRRIREVVEEKEVRELVVGLPLHMNGDEGELAVAARAFAEKLETQLQGIPVRLWDERMSSAEAERTLRLGDARAGRRKQMRDQVAAQLILQSWLDAQDSGAFG